MAAATIAGPDAHRMEEKKFEYFSSINSMASKIMQEREKVKSRHGSSWEKMTPQEQDNAIDNWMMDPHIRARYAMHKIDREEVVCYPKLLIQTGQKIVHFGEEDITWQDEHSAPFSWETKSQLDFSLITGSADQVISATQADPKTAKAPNSCQIGKSTPGTKVSVGESRRPEEESSFWKISAERSRLEGEQADFQSLTPSQIKSLEKGEKPLPSYLRQETSVTSKEHEAVDLHPPAPSRSTKQRAPKPPAPQPPVPAAVSATPASISISPNPAPPTSMSSTVAGWERSQSTLPSVSNTLEEMFSSNMMSKPSSLSNTVEKQKEEDGSPNFDSSPTFSQFNTSSSILKTGFDFLDNWPLCDSKLNCGLHRVLQQLLMCSRPNSADSDTSVPLLCRSQTFTAPVTAGAPPRLWILEALPSQFLLYCALDHTSEGSTRLRSERERKERERKRDGQSVGRQRLRGCRGSFLLLEEKQLFGSRQWDRLPPRSLSCVYVPWLRVFLWGRLTLHQHRSGLHASLLEPKKARGDVPDILPEPEPEPTSPVSDFENSYNYVLSRLASMDQAIHKLNVGHYTLDVKVSQLMDRLSRMDAKVGELEDNIREVYQHSKVNRKEIGRLEGCHKGHRMGYKCYLVYNSYEDYAGASRKCLERGGRMAMPRDRKEQEALADYVKSFFHPGNWPVWLGINDLRSEGMYLFDDGTRVSYFQWRKHYLSSQPDGGRRENCVAMSSDDGDWWDHYCDRTMNYLCEFDDRVAL
ncbi:hypothetical protein Q8A73_018278 [Channa argus]|nr:hypothetical protein Q8A73_018278 [Channa argus]